MIYVGIDPGLDGAVAVLNAKGELNDVIDTPTLLVEGGAKKKRKFVLQSMVDILENCENDTIAAIEQVGVMPDQGTVSAFCFGEGYGMWQGILAALGIPTHLVRPQVWKEATMDGMGKEKDASRLRVLQLYPRADVQLKKHHGRADAILIARWLWTKERPF